MRLKIYIVNRDFLFVLGAFGLPSIDRRAALAGIAAFSALSTRPAVAQDPPKPLRYWGGINHGTGFFPDEPFLSACIAAGRQLGLMAARTRMNTVGGRQVDAPWTWERRDRAFERYRAAGFQLHCILSFREFVDHGTGADWERNWRAFVRAAMARYGDQVEVWIIDNEPENRLAHSRPTPAQCVAFTRIAWEELHDLGIEDRCRIESPPVKAVDSPFLGAMLDAGLADCCHVIGTHAYNDQIEDARIRRPWERLAAAGVRDRPVAISESGSIAAWAPPGYPGGPERWRAVQYRYLRLQAKAFGFDYCLAFDLDRWRQREGEWRVATFDGDGAAFSPVQPVWDELRAAWVDEPVFANGGFEEPENGLGRWFVCHSVRASDPPELRLVDFPRNPALARSGGGCCRMRPGKEDLIVRQVADGLTPGHTHRVTARVWTDGGAATLKAIGFNRLDGTAERIARGGDPGQWQELTVEVVPSNPWLVVELRGSGPDSELRWDDVEVTALG